MIKLKLILILIAVVCTASFGFAQVGINTTTPLSTLDINGNLSVKEIGIVNALVPGSAIFIGGAPLSARPINDGVYISLTPVAVSGSNGPEFLLPNAINVPGRIYIIRNITPYGAYPALNAQIFSGGGAMFPKNSNAAISPVIMETSGFRKTLIFVSDGVNWTFFE
jgi:hypothetical protein